jgi:hypothetical protein
VNRTINKRLTLERERVRTLVVELSPARLRHVAGGDDTSNCTRYCDDNTTRTTTSTTQQ